jgi:hypothetical protein
MDDITAFLVAEPTFSFDSVERENEDVLKSAEGADARTINASESYRQKEDSSDPDGRDTKKTKELKK